MKNKNLSKAIGLILATFSLIVLVYVFKYGTFSYNQNDIKSNIDVEADWYEYIGEQQPMLYFHNKNSIPVEVEATVFCKDKNKAIYDEDTETKILEPNQKYGIRFVCDDVLLLKSYSSEYDFRVK